MKSHKFLMAAAMLLACSTARAQSADTTLSIEPVAVQSLRSPMPRQQVPYPLTIIGSDEIRRAPAASVADLLPSFVPIESANLQGLMDGIELRGFSASAMGTQKYTRLLLDGMPVGTRYAATTFLSGLSGIEVLQGPFSSLYGSGAMGGVVNLLTPRSDGPLAGRATLSYGSWNTFGANAALGGSISSKFDFDLGLDYQRRADDYRTGKSNLLKTTAYEKEVYGTGVYDTIYPNTSFDRTRATLRLGWDIAPDWRLNLYNELYHTANAPTNGTLWGVFGLIDHRITRHLHRLDLTGNVGRHAIRVTPFVSQEENRFTDVSYGNARRENDYNTYGLTAQDAIGFDWGSLVVGVDHLAERFNSANSREDGTPTEPYNPDYLNAALGGFAQLNFTAGDFSGIAGIRYDNTLLKTFKTPLVEGAPGKKNFGSFSPNLSLQYRLGGSVRLHAGVGRAFLAPDAFQLTGIYETVGDWGTSIYRGNPDLKAETATTWEAGAGYTSPDQALELDATLFFTRHDNKIITIYTYDNASLYDYVNADDASRTGFDLRASFDLGRMLDREWSWKFRGNLERFFRAQVTTANGTESQRDLSRTKIAFGTDFTYRRLSASISGRYVGSKRELNQYQYYEQVHPSLAGDEFIHDPDFIAFDASISCRAAKWLTIQATGANLLDELCMERDGYYMPGRNFTLGLTINF